MIGFVLCLILFIVAVICISSSEDEDGSIKNKILDKIGCISLVLSISFLVITLASYTILAFSDYKIEDEPYVTHQIMALSDNMAMRGKIYARSGYFDEQLVYLYAYRTSTGGMKTQKVTADNCTVYFTDNVSPKAEWYRWNRRFLFAHDEIYTCNIYIPEGSLKADYSIDLQ